MLKWEKPIICLSMATSGSESISISFFKEEDEGAEDSAGALVLVVVVVVVLVVVELCEALVEGSRGGRELGVFVPLRAGDDGFCAFDAAAEEEPSVVEFGREPVGLEDDGA